MKPIHMKWRNGAFPILDQCVRGRWKLIYGELEFEGTGDPIQVPEGYIMVDGGGFRTLLAIDIYEKSREYQGEGWAYQ